MKTSTVISRLALLLSLAGPPDSLRAQEFSRPDVEPLTTELVMELRVDIGAVVNMGQSDVGIRRFIPITGGEFEGRGIRGEVMPGGADWQTVRPDGVREIKAIYSIRTDDGAVIWVENNGLSAPTDSGRYGRSVLSFKAPIGPYDWLNQRVFTGTITLGAGFVTIRVFQVN